MELPLKAPIDLNARRSEISEILSDIERLTVELKAKGIDASQEEDNEALDIIKRIERKLLQRQTQR